MQSTRKAALTAGLSLIIMAIAAGFSYGWVHSRLLIPEDAEATLYNIKSSLSLFRKGIFGWVVIFICDIIAGWALYIFYKKNNQPISLLAAGARLVYAIILAVAISNLTYVLHIVDNGLGSNTSQQVIFYLEAFENVWSIGLIIFGLHLLLLGFLAYKSDAHKIFGILLSFAGLSYFLIHGIKLYSSDLSNQLNTLETILSIPMAVGELTYAIWLIIRGGKRSQKV